MNFCSDCGAQVSLQAVSGDERRRYVCADCGTTHYQCPNVLVATYVCVGEKILWIKRGIPPAVGNWMIPGGYMENDETPEAGASRELCEETGIEIPADEMFLVSVSSILHMAQTHLVFRCHLEQQLDTKKTAEAVEFGWFGADDLPWEELAFPGIEPHVRQVYRWLRKGNYGIRIGFIDEHSSQYRNFPLATTSRSQKGPV